MTQARVLFFERTAAANLPDPGLDLGLLITMKDMRRAATLRMQFARAGDFPPQCFSSPCAFPPGF